MSHRKSDGVLLKEALKELEIESLAEFFGLMSGFAMMVVNKSEFAPTIAESVAVRCGYIADKLGFDYSEYESAADMTISEKEDAANLIDDLTQKFKTTIV